MLYQNIIFCSSKEDECQRAECISFASEERQDMLTEISYLAESRAQGPLECM
jgi:hypothetical protein